MKRPVVLWTGPVGFFQVPGATLPDAYEVNLGCFGDRAPMCQNVAASYLADGRRIPTILARNHLPPEDEIGPFAVGAFSAGGSFVKRMLTSPADRARTSVVHLADAIWTSSWIDARGRVPPVDEGFVAYGLDAIDGPHLFIATVSPHPNKTWATGIENLRALRSAIEARSGRHFEPLEGFFGIDPAPERAYRLGNVIFAEYPEKPLGHGHTAIAGQVWDKIVKPWLAAAGQLPIPSPGPTPIPTPTPTPRPGARPTGLGLAVATGAVLAGYFGARWALGLMSS